MAYAFNDDKSKVEVLSASEANASIASEASARVAGDNRLNTRIDTILQEQDLDPNKDSELVDIRVGYDGVTRQTAGGAVREQVKNIDRKAGAVNGFYKYLPFDIVENEYIVQASGAFAPENGWNRSDYIAVEPNQTLFFDIDSTTGYCAFYDSSKAFISRFTANNTNPVKTPSNCYYIAISGVSSNVNTAVIKTYSDYYETVNEGKPYYVVVKNEYITNRGIISPYNGWSRTDFINVQSIAKLHVEAVSNSIYNCFYDLSKQYVEQFNIVAGANEIDVPANAMYVILSGESSYVNSLVVRFGEYRDSKQIQIIRDNLNNNGNGGHFTTINANDFIVAKKINQTTGAVEDSTNSSISGSYIRLANPESRFKLVCTQGYGVYFHQYEYDKNGDYVYLARSPYVENGGVFWPNLTCTHVKIEVYGPGSNGAVFARVAEFCDSFMLKEMGFNNNYLRVCTFNQAANYPSYTRDTEENLNKRIINYLNFIGNYDPDIICAQEALGNYFQPVSFEKSVSDVFDRKYTYFRRTGYQRSMWSKYNFSQIDTVYYPNHPEDNQRFYSTHLVHLPDFDVTVINTHNSFQGDSDFEYLRKGEFEVLAGILSTTPHCIVCGDFNAWSADEFDVFDGFNMANCGDYGVIDTWYIDTPYPDWPFKALDNIITTTDILIQNVERGPYDFNFFSDHAPLIADLRIL